MGSFTLIATFALLIGAAVASIGFKEGHEYEYKYYGKAVSGIPNLKNQFAGVLLRGDIRFQRLNSQTVLMMIERMEAIELNGPVPTGPTEKVLVDLQREAPQTIQQTVDLCQMTPAMRHPVRIQFENGKIHSFEVSRDCPEWALNIKKGVMSMIKLKLDESLAHGKAEQMNVVSKQYNDDIFIDYNVMEEDNIGMCLSTYAISSQPWEARPNQQVLNVTKYRNYNKCNKFQQYSLKTLQDEQCPNCKAAKQDVYSDVAVLKYNLRGNRHTFEIEKIEAEEQFLYAPYTANADYYLTNSSRTLVLRHKQPIQQQMMNIHGSNYKTLRSLQYRLVSREHLQAENLYVSGQFDLHKAPITPFNAHWTRQEERHQQEVKIQEVVALIHQIAQEMRNVEQEQKPEILSKALQAKKLIRMLNFQQLEQVYQECKHHENRLTKRVCQDILVMAGSAPALLVIKKAIETEEIHGEEAALLLQQIPTTVLTPHFKLIEQFKHLTKCSAAQKDSQVYTTAWLTFGSLISVACNGTGNTRETPSFVPKNFYCPTEVKQRLIQEIGQELRQVHDHWRKTVLIHALGNTKAPEAVHYLLRIISAQVTDCPVLRTKAIHALTGAAKVHPRMVMKVLAPIFFNVNEVAEVRAAALSVMISCHPTHQFLSKIAASTWNEPSQQIGSFVYSTLKSLAEADMPCLNDLKKDAILALELANQDFDGNLIDSQNMIFDDDKMDVFNMFNTLQTYWIRSNESIIPTEIVAKLNTTFAGYNFNQFKTQLHLKGVDEILNRMFGPKSAFYHMRNVADLFKSEKAESHKGFRQLVEALQIDTEERETNDFLLNWYVKFYDTQARNFHVTKQAVKNFVMGNVHNDLAKQFYQLIFGNGLTLNHHKLFNAHERLVQFPTPLGLPIVITVDSPVYMGVQGHMNVDVDASRNPNSVVPTNVRLSANIRPVVIMKKLTTVGIVLPYNNKHAAAVVSRKTLISLPINGQINFNLPEAKLTFTIGRSHEQRMHQESQQLPVVVYKVKPFTVIHKYTTALPYFRQQTVKPIQTLHQPHQYEEVKMTRTLGLPIVFQGRHEHMMTTGYSLWEQIQENGIWNTLNYIWLHPQTFKYSEHKIRVHFNNAETKEFKGIIDFDFTNSKLQRNMRDGQYTPNQIWSYLLGWANIPMPCKRATELQSNIYDDELGQYEKEYNREYVGDYKYGNKFENEYEQEQQEQYKYRPSLLNKFNFWKNWQSVRDSEYDNVEELENQGNWFNNYRQSRRYPFASKYEGEYKWATQEWEGQKSEGQVLRTNIAENVPVWKLYAKFFTIGGQERSVTVLLNGKRNFAQLSDSMTAEIKIRNPKIYGNQMTVCTEALAQYPAIPCSYDHTFNPSSVGPIHFQSKTTWGHNGCSAENHMEVIAKIGKSAKQIYYEQEAKPWYYKQCMEERQKGLYFNEACAELYDQVTALNKIDITARYSHIPAIVKNMTYKVDDLLKATFYKKMSNNALSGKHQPGQVRLVVEFLPNKDAIDVKIEKPTETTIFKEIYTTVEPMSAHRTIAQQVADALTDRQIPATCDISGGRFINTFNNLTYKHEMGQCTYLAARDCSPNGLFAVLVSGRQAQKSGPSNGIYCEVQLLKNTIKMTPLTPRMDRYKISINGQVQELTQGETVIVESGYLAPGTPEPLAYITLTGHFVHVKAPAHGIEIKYDGKNVRVETSYFYSGKLCGLCGNFDGETKNEFEGPHGCMYAKGHDFAESYIINNGECQQKAHQARMTCAKNNQETTAVYPQLKNLQSALYTAQRNVDETYDFSNVNYESNMENEYPSQYSQLSNQYENEGLEYGVLGNEYSQLRNYQVEGEETCYGEECQNNQFYGRKYGKKCYGENCEEYQGYQGLLNQYTDEEYQGEYQGKYQVPFNQYNDEEYQGKYQVPFNQYNDEEYQGKYQVPFNQYNDEEYQGKYQVPFNQYNDEEYQGYQRRNNEMRNIKVQKMESRNQYKNLNRDLINEDMENCFGEECQGRQYYGQYKNLNRDLINQEDEENCFGEECQGQQYYGRKFNKMCYGEDCEEFKGYQGEYQGFQNEYNNEEYQGEFQGYQGVFGYKNYQKYNDEECVGEECEYNRQYVKQCDEDDYECKKYRLKGYGYDNECQCNEDDITCDCQNNYYGQTQFYKQNERDSTFCTVYRNKITYGKPESSGYSTWSKLYNRFYGNQMNDMDNSYYTEGNKICFSIEAHLKCKSECQPKQQQLQTIRYHCMNRDSYEAQKLMRIQPYQRLYQLQDKTVHFTKQEYIPSYCQAY